MIKKNVEVITLIFKSTDYLDLIYNEFKSGKSNVDGWDVTYRIVANDATPEVLEKLKNKDRSASTFDFCKECTKLYYKKVKIRVWFSY